MSIQANRWAMQGEISGRRGPPNSHDWPTPICLARPAPPLSPSPQLTVLRPPYAQAPMLGGVRCPDPHRDPAGLPPGGRRREAETRGPCLRVEQTWSQVPAATSPSVRRAPCSVFARSSRPEELRSGWQRRQRASRVLLGRAVSPQIPRPQNLQRIFVLWVTGEATGSRYLRASASSVQVGGPERAIGGAWRRAAGQGRFPATARRPEQHEGAPFHPHRCEGRRPRASHARVVRQTGLGLGAGAGGRIFAGSDLPAVLGQVGYGAGHGLARTLDSSRIQRNTDTGGHRSRGRSQRGAGVRMAVSIMIGARRDQGIGAVASPGSAYQSHRMHDDSAGEREPWQVILECFSISGFIQVTVPLSLATPEERRNVTGMRAKRTVR